jgi:hypothetical protein
MGYEEWNHTMLGAGFGVKYNVVNYWLGYYPKNAYENRSTGVKYIGTGVKIGIGFSVTSKLSCNFEMLYNSITTATLSGFEAPFDDYNISSVHVAVAVPIR